MEITKTVAVNLRSLREGQKLSREAFAKMAGVSAQTIYDIENENKKPSLLVIESLAKALSVKPSRLLETDEAAPVLTMPVSKTLQRLLLVPDSVYDAIDGLSPKNDVWKVIEGLLKVASEQEREDRGESKDA